MKQFQSKQIVNYITACPILNFINVYKFVEGLSWTLKMLFEFVLPLVRKG